MKKIIAIVALLAAPTAQAQQISKPATQTLLKLIPAVKKTASVGGENYTIARDEDNKIVFVKTETDQRFVRPILIQVEVPENNK